MWTRVARQEGQVTSPTALPLAVLKEVSFLLDLIVLTLLALTGC